MNALASKTLRPARLLAALSAALALCAAAPAQAQSKSGFTFNGVAHVSWWYNEYDNYDQPTGPATDSRTALAATHVNWAALLTTWYMDNYQSNAIVAHTTPDQKTPTDDSLRFAIRDFHSKGISVMLKPHVDLWNDSAHWRGQIAPTDVNAWFQSYTAFITHYAQLAADEGCEGLVIGTELITMTGAANQARWYAVIDAVRAIFPGIVTYAANSTYGGDEFTSVSFWDRVDVMGMDAYFPLTSHADPTEAELIAAWSKNVNGENLVAAIQNLASAHNKPVIFTELGYKSVAGANTQPYNSSLWGNYDPTEQANCYDAAFTVFSQYTSFFKGIFWWAWPVPVPQANDLDYNPRTKPAEAVLTSWQGATNTSNFTIAASPSALTVTQGTSGTSTISIARTAFTGAVALSVGPLPTGVTASLSTTSTTGNSSVLTMSASTAAATNVPSTVTVTATGSGITRTTAIALTVAPAQQSTFGLSAAPTSLSVTQGSASGASTIAIARANYPGSISFTTGTLPSGVTATFSPSSTTGGSVTVTFAATSTASTGQVPVTITGTGSTGLAQTTTVTLTVNPIAQSTFSLSAGPATLSVTRGSTSGASTIGIARTSYTSSVAFTTSALPAGVTATFSPSSTTGNSVTVTFAASSTATTGSSTVTITGTGSNGLVKTTSLTLAVNPVQQSSIALSIAPTALSVSQGASGVATVSIARTSFTGAVTLSTTTPVPTGVTVTFGPATTGNSATVTVAASSTAAVTSFSLAITGTGTGVTAGTTLGVNITPGNTNTGSVTATPVVGASSPWFNEEEIRLDSTATLSALSVTIVVQRTAGVGLNGLYNTVGGSILQTTTVTTSTITYQFTLATGQTLGPGTGRLFAAQMSGAGTAHPTSGDTWTVAYTPQGGASATLSGNFP